MSVSLTIAGTTYNYPTSGEDPNWAEEASGWAEAVTEALNTLLSPGDILQMTYPIDNNIQVPEIINGLLFDSAIVRAANVSYTVYRTSIDVPSGQVETGSILLTFDDNASVGSKWKFSQNLSGTAGVSFSVTDNGQIYYTSTDIGDTGYIGTIRFSAKTLSRT